MIKVQSIEWPGLDLVEVENLRKWIKYNPECYVERVKSDELKVQKLEDNLILLRIDRLYALIKKIDGRVSKKERHFCLKNPHSLDDKLEYEKLVDSIPSLDVSYYASMKLTDEERQFAYDFMKQCNKENSREMMKYAENYPNIFVGSYMVELLRHHSESDYIYSSKNLGIMAKSANKKLIKKFDDIRRREGASLEFARNRVIR